MFAIDATQLCAHDKGILVAEADADAEHAADHVIQRVVDVVLLYIRWTDVGDVVDLGIQLGLVADIPVGAHVEIHDRVDVLVIVGRRLDQLGRGEVRAGAGRADYAVPAARHTAGVPAFRQVQTPDIVLVALGFLQLPGQDVTAGLVVGLAVAATAQQTRQFDIALGAGNAGIRDELAGVVDEGVQRERTGDVVGLQVELIARLQV